MRFSSILRWIFRAFLALILAISVFWIWQMPDRNERGVFANRGGGYVFQIGRITASMIAVTDAGCTPFMTFPANHMLLKRLGNAQLMVDGDVLEVHTGGIHPMVGDRLPALPSACEIDLDPNSATDNFNVFWAAFNENYAFFDLYGVDWDARREAALKTLNAPDFEPDTEGMKLRQVMATAMEGLDDGHIFLGTKDWGISPAQEDFSDEEEDLMLDVALGQFTDGYTQVEGTNMFVGWAAPDVGLIHLEDMDVNAPLGSYETEVAEAGMKIALARLTGAKGIILDNRFNPGGSDNISMGYASFFTQQPRIVFSKAARKGDGFWPERVITQWAQSQVFDGPVVLLNSTRTGSAAEIFTYAMRGLPQVTVMGTNTSGAQSDIRGQYLPNGWVLGLSNEVYKSPEGQIFEGVGTPPDVFQPVDLDGFKAGKDTLIEAAIAHIQTR